MYLIGKVNESFLTHELILMVSRIPGRSEELDEDLLGSRPEIIGTLVHDHQVIDFNVLLSEPFIKFPLVDQSSLQPSFLRELFRLS